MISVGLHPSHTARCDAQLLPQGPLTRLLLPGLVALPLMIGLGLNPSRIATEFWSQVEVVKVAEPAVHLDEHYRD